ncbi:hypothetical protein QA312_06355 [Glaesserella parasuis]|uniref:hypothetical protein n=1 Tax=Glaesserella parasuis TaxID=738 RepID=UPI0003AC4A6B|nr:hypothetical protein [Glaesserella parasuis]EQA06686.1 hypothetical protein HPSD74_1996 [Glaesserella parasuis D74]MCT8580591.1 hypothetical protein [Glaesserella parasuis]MCT8594189.1 hypothetical protein [Glaesserella parasuis]MCT8717215.1 hypothetical protein [Glaesserella parasuis]MCT8719280.1 hypothetical protein [Glaesserella parasuis]
MFKMIGNLFSVTSKAIGTTIDVTNSALNEVNKGLDSFNSNLRKHTEKMELLRDLSKKVYENKISYAESLRIVKSQLGEIAYPDYEEKLDLYRDLEYVDKSYDIFGMGSTHKVIAKELVKKELINKYGRINETYFEYRLRDRREDIIRLLLNGSQKSYFDFQRMNDSELIELYHKEIELYHKEIDKVNKYFEILK